ncbi:hypothetical protein ACWCXH_33340 [Kitasatospora sp. NPDC001660]
MWIAQPRWSGPASAIGLAAHGHRVTGTDLSPVAAARATREAARRGLHLPTAADMRHALRSGGLLLLTTRPHDTLRRERPAATPPQTSGRDGRRSVIFQLSHSHEDGERYDLELFRMAPDDTTGEWHAEVHHATYWALTQAQLTTFATEAGFTAPTWALPEETGFFQPMLIAQVP